MKIKLKEFKNLINKTIQETLEIQGKSPYGRENFSYSLGSPGTKQTGERFVRELLNQKSIQNLGSIDEKRAEIVRILNAALEYATKSLNESHIMSGDAPLSEPDGSDQGNTSSMAANEIVGWMRTHGEDPSVKKILSQQGVDGLANYLNMIPTFDAFSEQDVVAAVEELDNSDFFAPFISQPETTI